jgi:hypothetical protein
MLSALTSHYPQDIFYVACAPEYVPLSREIDPCLVHDYELVRQLSTKGGPYSLDEDDTNDNRYYIIIYIYIIKII